jgi:metal iron transporter
MQYLVLKLGSVTGLTLAEMNHKYLPRWMELGVYAVSEICCICTDISQVIGTAFAWNLLIPKLSLDVACVITLFDTLIILAFYSNTGNLRSIRYFEMFVASLVLVIFICVATMLGQVSPPAMPTWDGFVPSRELFVGDGLFTSLAMIGGMMMPHALYVGSSIGRPRLLEYDSKYHITTYNQDTAPHNVFYRPSVRAIKSTLSYATWDLCLCMFVVGMLVNCGLTIVSAAAFGAQEDFSDLYSLYELFVHNVNQLTATLFAVALLFSGISAGIVSTMAGQTVMEGAFQIRVNPFTRRLITRCVAIVPAFTVAVSVGASGLADALAVCNYILSIGLIFISLPVVVYVTSDKYMQVPDDEGTGMVSFKLGRASAVVAWFIWGVVIALDLATVVLLGMGLSID